MRAATLSPRSTAGFSLIEALVTLVIIGLGVLAAAGLQIGARKGQQEASQRTAASAAIQDLIERMNANPAGANTYIAALGANPSNDNGGLPASAATTCQTAGACTPAALATADLGHWWGTVTGTNVTDTSNSAEPTPLFDKPTVCLCLRPGATDDFRLTLAWRGAGPAGAFAIGDDKFGLTCGDNESAIYDDPDTPAADVNLRRTETVRYVFSSVSGITLASAPACAS